MEAVARSLDIPPTSGIYALSQTTYHRLRMRAGINCKYTELVCMATCLKLASDYYSHPLEMATAAKKGGVLPNNLEACLAFVIGLVGVECGLVSLNTILTRCCYPAVLPIAIGIMESLQASPLRPQGQFLENSAIVIAACASLALQSLNLRVSVLNLSRAAYVNHQHVQRCALGIRPIIADHLEKISKDEELIKKIKAEGKQVKPKSKRMMQVDDAPAKTIAKVSKSTMEPALKSQNLDLMGRHFQHEFGYSCFPNNRIPSQQEFSQMYYFLQSIIK